MRKECPVFPWAALGPELAELLDEVWEVPALLRPDCLVPPGVSELPAPP